MAKLEGAHWLNHSVSGSSHVTIKKKTNIKGFQDKKKKIQFKIVVPFLYIFVNYHSSFHLVRMDLFMELLISAFYVQYGDN